MIYGSGLIGVNEMIVQKLSNASRYVFAYFGEDKKDHFIIGGIAMALFLVTIPTFSTSIGVGVGVGILYIFILGFGMEVWQWLTGTGRFEVWDALAVVIGGACTYLPYLTYGLLA